MYSHNFFIIIFNFFGNNDCGMFGAENWPPGSPWCPWGRWGPGHWQWWSWCCHSVCPAPAALLGGKDKRPDYTAAYVTLYCLIIHTYAICFIHSSYHMDNIRSFLNVQLKCIWNIFEKPPWTMPLTTEIWIAVYMIRCRGLKLQDWHFRVDHCTLIYQNHTVFINRHCRAHTCQVDLQGMISLKLGIPVYVPAICGTRVSMFISTVPGKSSQQTVTLPLVTIISMINLLWSIQFWLDFKYFEWLKQLCCGYCLHHRHKATLVCCNEADPSALWAMDRGRVYAINKCFYITWKVFFFIKTNWKLFSFG